ncbi:hypothetical protein M0802_015870 [Mischocyttarus mexicanus]|nr:hypothetical protein M0802_015870 [Mischocyttarus mexicanus]
MAENEELYIRSMNNYQISFVKFINCTHRTVAIYWIDYEGQAIKYASLQPARSLEVDTFVTHPWIFADDETNDRYLVNNSDVFYPEPWLAGVLNGREPYYPHRVNRTQARIIAPMYTLLELSSRAITKCLNYKEQVLRLNIPRCLQRKLASMLPDQNNVEEDLNIFQITATVDH